MQSKEELKEKFNIVLGRRQHEGIRMTKEVNEVLSLMEYIINKDLESFNLLSFAICGSGKRKFNVSKDFQSSFSACSTAQKINYFSLAVEDLIEKRNTTSIKIVQDDWTFEQLDIKIVKGIKINGIVKLQLKNMSLDCNHFQIDLSTYILRKSIKDKDVFCLQTLAQQEPSKIRLMIVDNNSEKEFCLVKMGNYAFRQHIESLNKKEELHKKQIKLLKKKSPGQSEAINESEINLQIVKDTKKVIEQVQRQPNSSAKRSLIQQLIDNLQDVNTEEEVYEYFERKVEEAKAEMQHMGKIHRNRLKILLPLNYNLNDLNAYNEFKLQVKIPEKKLFIYHSKRHNSFKLQLTVKCPKQKVLEHFCNAQNQKLWNNSVNESHVKWGISSENSCMFYRKLNSISEWFRERDFLFVRYLVKKGKSHYIVDRSIDNTHFIPFQSIQRGNIDYCIFKIEQIEEGTIILMDLKIQHEGLLTNDLKKTMTLMYLKQYANFESFIENFNGLMTDNFDYNWEVEQNLLDSSTSSFASFSSAVFEQPLENIDNHSQDNEQSFYSIIDEPVRYEVTEKEHQQKQQQKLKKLMQVKQFEHDKVQLDNEGRSIISKAYIGVKHPVKPIKGTEKRRALEYDHIMLKNDFAIDKTGGMLLTNQTKIAAQNNVIKFIMSTLKKNLFSGKGILNISLPVEIFNVDSNIQRLCQSMALAPDLLEKKACLTDDPVQRFKHCIAFALSNSILYFDIDKPFNPILGQTFQGVIDGCPVYAEQTSHHPPISSILLVGRGYRVWANLQAKVYVHLNSGEGVNQGMYTIEFDNGEKVMFQTAPGQVSGLAVGDRKYRIKGKMIVIDPKHRLCSVIKFQDENGMFSGKKWKLSDQMEGQIVRCTPGYIRNFFTSENKKDIVGPAKKQVESTLSTISGRWIDKLLINDQVFYDIRQIPHEMIHYQYPLPSNSNYREDLIFRKQNDLARSQQEKERLQILQRNDRKLREKYNGPAH